MSDFLARVSAVQAELKAPKGQYNSFGKYKYRSCEDILEAVKPLLHKYKLVLTISDALYYMGERYYIQATATLIDTESGEKISNSALARESAEKKGMDDSQITGTASSYARKYALNGLFCIDDTKDADTDEYKRSYPADAAFPPVDVPKRADVTITPCADCGKTLEDAVSRNGEIWSAQNIANYSTMRFGRVLCPDCQKAASKR